MMNSIRTASEPSFQTKELSRHETPCPDAPSTPWVITDQRVGSKSVQVLRCPKALPSGYDWHSHGKIHPFLIGKAAINRPFSMAMVNNRWVKKTWKMVNFPASHVWLPGGKGSRQLIRPAPSSLCPLLLDSSLSSPPNFTACNGNNKKKNADWGKDCGRKTWLDLRIYRKSCTSYHIIYNAILYHDVIIIIIIIS